MGLNKHIPTKRYLGDGAYVESAGYGHAIVITTEDGFITTNRVVLDLLELSALEEFRKDLAIGVQRAMDEKGSHHGA